MTTEELLAAATALLENIAKHRPEYAVVVEAFLAGQPAAPTTYDLALREWHSGSPGAARPGQPAAPLADDLGTALMQVVAAEHAAPTRTDAPLSRNHRNGSPVRSAIAREMLDQLHYQGACNTQEDDLERWAFTADALAQALTVRTGAEQRVLDACATANISAYAAPDGARVLTYTARHVEDICRAELARRGRL